MIVVFAPLSVGLGVFRRLNLFVLVLMVLLRIFGFILVFIFEFDFAAGTTDDGYHHNDEKTG